MKNNSVYRNAEGYYDPTAGAVIAACDRKARSDRRKAIRKANARARKLAAAAAAEAKENPENQEGGGCE